jgi:hypothetical protein
MDITITTNLAGLLAGLTDLQRQQIPFAAAVALTRVAGGVQDTERSELRDTMTLRNRWSASGVQMNRAEKRDFPQAFAEVGIEERRSYLIDHITGADRRAKDGGRVAIPDTEETFPSGSANIRRSSSGRIPRGQQVRGLKRRKRGKPFTIKGKSGNELLVRRTGNERYPLEILYAFQRSVKIDKTWNFEGIARREVGATYDREFGRALGQAIASAKTRAERQRSRSRGKIIGSGK